MYEESYTYGMVEGFSRFAKTDGETLSTTILKTCDHSSGKAKMGNEKLKKGIN